MDTVGALTAATRLTAPTPDVSAILPLAVMVQPLCCVNAACCDVNMALVTEIALGNDRFSAAPVVTTWILLAADGVIFNVTTPVPPVALSEIVMSPGAEMVSDGAVVSLMAIEPDVVVALNAGVFR